jgi:hypothetical protein
VIARMLRKGKMVEGLGRGRKRRRRRRGRGG